MPEGFFVIKSAMMKIGFIGAGTVGTALAVLLSSKGYPVVAVASRTAASAATFTIQVPGCSAAANNQAVADTADLVFITTPDDIIPTIAQEVSWRKGQSVVHCSGAASTDILEPAKQVGAATATMHPLQSFAGVEKAIENIPGSTFAIEAEGTLLALLEEMSSALGGYPIRLKAADKTLYHASAVMACNYFVTLMNLSAELWETFGASKQEALRALMPLLKGTLNNLEQIGLPDCLTGPIARGDTDTIKKHLAALNERNPDIMKVYTQLGQHTIPIARAKSKVTAAQVTEMENILVNNTR
ncbi:Rossmann-like and DUF2520 domain-containing protein [Chloroflexota bacterium]